MQLLLSAFGSATHPLAEWYTPMLSTQPLVCEFIAANSRKIHKKVRQASDPESLRDLRCELAVATMLLDRRSPLVYESPLQTGKRAPDFLLTHKGHTPVAVEVTRLRMAQAGGTTSANRLMATICGKLGQLQPAMANLLVIVNDDQPCDSAERPVLLAGLQRRAMAGDNAFFAYRGLPDARSAYQGLTRLSGVLLVETTAPEVLLPCPLARQPLPPDLLRQIATWELAGLVSS